MKLLIVDDNKEMRKSIRSIIASNGDLVFECENGSTVLSVYTKEMPDCVFMDINMPIMNGIEATEKLIKNFPKARVIIISNYNDDELREEAKSAGAEKYFIKDNLMEVKNYIKGKYIL